MSSRSEVSRRVRYAGWLLAILTATQIACQPSQQTAVTAQPKGELVIEDNALGAWIAMNNTFTIPHATSPDDNKNYYWSGILLQVGDYPPMPNSQPPRYNFDKLYFSKNGETVGTALVRGSYSAKKFWVNIVSQRTGFEPPLEESDVAALLPTTPADPYCQDATALDPRCLRGKKIHGGMEPVFGVVTYWQGPQGFELKAVQPNENLGSSYTFKLLDDFSVDVYDVAADGKPTKVISYTAGAIDRITVAKQPYGPSEGDKQDPPWPGK